jgi:hypothetical protein
MTPEGIAEIEARVAATSPGSWNMDGPHWWGKDDCTYVISADPHRDAVAIMPRERQCDPAKREANARFIAYARTDVPALLAEVKRLQAALDPGDGALYDRIEAALDAQVDVDDYTPSSAASATYDVVLPVVAGYDIELREARALGDVDRFVAASLADQLAEAEAGRDRARDAAVSLQQELATELERAAAEVESLSIGDGSGDRANKLVAWLRTRARRERLALSARGESS